MKAWVHKASNYDAGWVEEVNNLEDVLKLADNAKNGIVLSKNQYYHVESFPNKERFEEYKEKGKFECELEIIIYDDYLE